MTMMMACTRNVGPCSVIALRLPSMSAMIIKAGLQTQRTIIMPRAHISLPLLCGRIMMRSSKVLMLIWSCMQLSVSIALGGTPLSIGGIGHPSQYGDKCVKRHDKACMTQSQIYFKLMLICVIKSIVLMLPVLSWFD